MKPATILLAMLAATLYSTHASHAAGIPAATFNTATIAVADDAIPSEMFAAEEFQRLWESCTGLKLPIAASPATGQPAILIGPGAAPDIDTAALGDEGLHIRVEPQTIAITGGRPRGTLYGVYEFFERYLGVRFLTGDHTHIPEDAASRALETGDFTFTPPFSFRWSYYGEINQNPPFAAIKRVNTVPKAERLGGKTPQNLINHTFYRLCPAEKFGQDHPEYFALVDGERKLQMHGGGPELCLTNPGVLDVVTEAVLADLEAAPHLRNYSVSQNDNDAYCRCDNCEAINQREGTPMGTYLAFVNAVAERIEPRFPDTKIGTLAYWHTRKPPKTIRPRHNVQIQLCSIECCTLHPINDPNCPKNREFCDDLANWKAICNDIWIWNYNTNFASYDLPFPNLRVIGPNVDYFLNNNVHGLFMQAAGNCMSAELSDLRNYVITHTIWNPAEGGWARVEEFCNLHYGPAARPILDYLTYLHDNAEARGVHPECFPTGLEVGLDQDVALKALDYFKRAMALAPDDATRARVEKASLSAYKALVATSGSTRYEDGMCYLDIPAEYGTLIDDYIALGRKHGLTMARETVTAEDFFNEIKGMTQGFPAVQLENPVWRVTVLPGENGKLAAMLHKPSGRDVAFPRGRMFNRHRAMEEWGILGFTDKDLFEFHAEKTGNGVTMTAGIDGRMAIERRIEFDPANPDRVLFRTRITHQGAEPADYQVWVHPEYDSDSTSDDENVLAAYINNGGWRLVNTEYKIDRGSNDALLQNPDGGFAFYNHEKNFGVIQTFNPAQIQRAKLFWHPSRSQVNLELYTTVKKLNQGESLEYGYEIACLQAPPR
ncbi:MAG: DUF4838 domain-containing protein [Candidatus Hydrogenedentes bacterium]|nr:DUF4838 domain-containing protein [Candidatus Hydrogenedentota bacterium]